MNALEPLTRLVPECLRRLGTWPRARIEQAERLAAILQVDGGELASIRMGPRYHYRPFTAMKPDGSARRLLAPSPSLKNMQRRLLDNYLATITVHPSATAFRAGSSIVHNARVHSHQQLIATVDLRDFFESTSAARVRTFFVKQGWRDDELGTLMRLCVYHNGLPQGAPTSPSLSNLVNLTLDQRLARLAERARAIYTRYGDDLTFSWSCEHMPGGFQDAVEDALHAAGYEVQPRKGWGVTGIRDRPVVTGVVLLGDGRLRIPWALRWRMWCLRLKSWWSADPAVLARLHGCRGYARMVR